VVGVCLWLVGRGGLRGGVVGLGCFLRPSWFWEFNLRVGGKSGIVLELREAGMKWLMYRDPGRIGEGG